MISWLPSAVTRAGTGVVRYAHGVGAVSYGRVESIYGSSGCGHGVECPIRMPWCAGHGLAVCCAGRGIVSPRFTATGPGVAAWDSGWPFCGLDTGALRRGWRSRAAGRVTASLGLGSGMFSRRVTDSRWDASSLADFFQRLRPGDNAFRINSLGFQRKTSLMRLGGRW